MSKMPSSPVETAFLVLGMTQSQTPIPSHLVKEVRGNDWEWVQTAPLFEVALRLLAIARIAPQAIDGACSAWLAKRLIAVEEVVGGPYRELDGKLSIASNALLEQFFVTLGGPLPNLERFLQAIADTEPHEFEKPRAYWATTWPHRLVDLSKKFDIIGTDVESAAIRLCLDSTRPKKERSTSVPEHNAVIQQVYDDLQSLTYPVKDGALRIYRSVVRADKRNEISMLATYFAQSLSRSPSNIDERLCHELGVANFYTWMAYTLYDDFIDDEGDPTMLPIANIMHRASLGRYHTLSGTNNSYSTIVSRAYDSVDAANTWEVTNCRSKVNDGTIVIDTLPNYGNGDLLARRAIVHGLGPTFITLRSKMSNRDRESVQKGLVHYLIARQLNDDIHDWVEDLQQGHISFVVAHLLREARVKPGSYQLHELIERLRTLFWKTGLEEICLIILSHTAQARHHFTKNGIVESEGIFMRTTLRPIEDSVQHSITIHQHQKRFLHVYSRPAL